MMNLPRFRPSWAFPISCRSAFSLIEALIAIAIIAVLASIAVGFLGDSARRAIEEARNRRNAQEVATIASAVSAAGVSFVVPGDPVESTRLVVQGIQATEGVFAGKTFRLPHLSENDIIAAAYYLDVDGSQLVYNGARTHP